MNPVVRRVLGVLACGGIGWVAARALVPSVWSVADDVELLVLFAAVLGWTVADAPHDRPWRWAAFVVAAGVANAAMIVGVVGGLDLLFGGWGGSSIAQRVVVATSFALFAVYWAAWARMFSRPAVDDHEREVRRAAIRENVRREIAELERRGSEPPTDA